MTPTETEMDLLYRERAHLVAHLAAIYPACLMEESDAPGYALLYLTTPAGQLSWHIAARDLELFAFVKRCTTATWDGHTTPEKYARLSRLTGWLLAGMRPADM